MSSPHLDENKFIAERIRLARHLRGWSAADLARACDIPERTLHKWEEGDRRVGAAAVARIAKACGCTTDYLLGLNDHPGPLPPDAWVVDTEFVDAVRNGTWDLQTHGDTGSFPIPRKVRIVSSVEHEKLAKDLRKLIRGIEERNA